MGRLEKLTGPADLRALDDHELDELATEIRDFLVTRVSRTGGHLGPNLGVVELSIALHRVFDSPREPILFDTGHQSYVHKILTGRAAAFDRLRQEGGLSGYPSRQESEHDLVENQHASTSLSYADGLAKAFAIRGEDRRRRVNDLRRDHDLGFLDRPGLDSASRRRRRLGPRGLESPREVVDRATLAGQRLLEIANPGQQQTIDDDTGDQQNEPADHRECCGIVPLSLCVKPASSHLV